MVIVSFKQTEINLLSSILSDIKDDRIYEILMIFNKLYKVTRSRLLKKLINKNIDNFKKLNNVNDLGVYKK